MRVLVLLLLPLLALAADERVEVRIVNVEVTTHGYSTAAAVSARSRTSCTGASCATQTRGSVRPGASYELDGAVLTLQLPDGRTVVVYCTPPGRFVFTQRSCRYPRSETAQAELKRKKIELFWTVATLDGREAVSETYEVLSVEEP